MDKYMIGYVLSDYSYNRAKDEVVNMGGSIIEVSLYQDINKHLMYKMKFQIVGGK